MECNNTHQGTSHERISWATCAGRVLNDEGNSACYRAFERRYPRGLLDQALKAALAYPEAEVRRTRGALFVGIVRMLAKQDPWRSQLASAEHIAPIRSAEESNYHDLTNH